MKIAYHLERGPSWDRYRPYIFKIALAMSLFFGIIVVNYETTSQTIQTFFVEEIEPEFTRVIPRTKLEKPKVRVAPPTPPKPVKKRPQIIEATDQVEEVEKADEEFKDLKDVVEEPAPTPEVGLVEVAPKVEIIKEEPKEEEVLTFAEQMPIFGDCWKDDFTDQEIKICSDKALLGFIMNRIKYPALAREAGIEGTVILQFVVNKKGEITKVTIARDIGGGCGNEAKKALEALPHCRPGKQNGRPVHVLYTVPVNFQLF